MVLPAKPAKVDLSQIDAFTIMRRTVARLPRGVCPPDTLHVTAGVDVGKRLCHWTAIAWIPNATPHVVDYGRLEVPSDQMPEEQAVLLARDRRDETGKTGWKLGDTTKPPTFVLVDAGWHQRTIQLFAAESGPGYFGAKGFGALQRRTGQHRRETGSKVVGIGERYSLIQSPDGLQFVEVDVDVWKSWLHSRLHTPTNKPGALTLFDGGDHLSFAKHLTAEKLVEFFDPKEGSVTRWEAVSRNNHWLDATMLACVGGHAAGARLVDTPAPAPAPSPAPESQEDYNPLTSFRGRW